VMATTASITFQPSVSTARTSPRRWERSPFGGRRWGQRTISCSRHGRCDVGMAITDVSHRDIRFSGAPT
jgi:hypothetical protein